MVQLGVGMSSEELSAREIVRAVALAEEVGFRNAWVSDHFHPWIDAQGESPFVWSTLGAISSVTERIRIGTGVTCPIVRIHPAIVAQAAATTQTLFDGRFWLGVGTGEALNEHILATKWPEARAPGDARRGRGDHPSTVVGGVREPLRNAFSGRERGGSTHSPTSRPRSTCPRSASKQQKLPHGLATDSSARCRSMTSSAHSAPKAGAVQRSRR